MNKTANFDLPQWEKSDFIQMDDFNAAFGTLDGALKTQADALAGKAGGEDLAAVRQGLQGQIPLWAGGGIGMTATAETAQILWRRDQENVADASQQQGR